jgi:glycine dehydrogenase
MTFKAIEGLDCSNEFVSRHIGPSDKDIRYMLEALGFENIEQLISSAIPANIRVDNALNFDSMSEAQALDALTKMSAKNVSMKSLIGLGYHDTHTPSVILRNLLENPGWYTAYTPYQSEISQGRLEALLNFQQVVMDLTAMPMANASLLDEGTAAAEAMTLMLRVGKSKSKSKSFFVAKDCLPQTISVLLTRAEPLEIDIQIGDPLTELKHADVFGALLQFPNVDGEINDYRGVAESLHDTGALLAVAADPMSLVLLSPPGEWGADIVVGSTQRFGVPLGFGGPHAAFMACREEYKRQIPGRVIGVSEDKYGKIAFRMALQTREQHIRREKATSNICTAQVLLANVASMYCVYHGPVGLRRIADRIHLILRILTCHLRKANVAVRSTSFFDTIVFDVPSESEAIHKRAVEKGYNLRIIGPHSIGLSVNETITYDHISELVEVITNTVLKKKAVLDCDFLHSEGIPDALVRQSPILTHPIFNKYHSETAMMRYMRGLEEKDLALNRSMIPLGSCTMKLNAASEMMPITWAGFSKVHPFAPLDQTAGYQELIADLEHKLCDITGFPGVSLQPNAGSQGEYAGLLTIRAYQKARGEGYRNVCLIPSSAHGTNPASAVMSNMKVVVVECDTDGNVNLSDLRDKVALHGEQLAAVMVTYPSTHGVFEEDIREICDVVHAAGGQVYMDGANLQAMVGLCLPGRFGPDVMHLNLHKTFCIPHGGGGPGVGPIAVADHLCEFLPTTPLSSLISAKSSIGAVSSAPWGSASILPISWAYIAMMGGDGLTKASEVSILSANYVAKKLSGHFDILFTGNSGLVAHECIIDTRRIQSKAKVTVDDVAKRLMDYGFHSPTMSWPVAQTLMMEPTESEPLEEIDRFCEAMILIAGEADKISNGEWPENDNPLVNAPHTAQAVTADTWTHPYTRKQAAFPNGETAGAKYWPSVSRIDNVVGDRSLVCSCPPIESYS